MSLKKIMLLVLLGWGISVSKLHAQSQSLRITIGTSEFIAMLDNNPTVDAFVKLLPMTVSMSELGGVEKFYYLPQNLPGTATNPGTINAGDLMLYSANCLVLFYATHSTSYSYIKLGHISNITGLTAALGAGNVQASYELYNATGVDELNRYEKPYLVSPNPATDHIKVSGMSIKQLSLIDMNGKVVTQSKENMIYTGNIPAGTYWLRMNSTELGMATEMIILK